MKLLQIEWCPVDVDAVCQVRMGTQPPARKWAPRHNGQSLVSRARNGRTDEHRPDPAPFQLRGHACVDKDQPPGLRSVHKLRHVSFELKNESTLIG